MMKGRKTTRASTSTFLQAWQKRLRWEKFGHCIKPIGIVVHPTKDQAGIHLLPASHTAVAHHIWGSGRKVLIRAAVTIRAMAAQLMLLVELRMKSMKKARRRTRAPLGLNARSLSVKPQIRTGSRWHRERVVLL